MSGDNASAHVKNIFQKFNVHDRTAAMAEALRRGIIHINQAPARPVAARKPPGPETTGVTPWSSMPFSLSIVHWALSISLPQDR
jgi:hypothetical protein